MNNLFCGASDCSITTTKSVETTEVVLEPNFAIPIAVKI